MAGLPTPPATAGVTNGQPKTVRDALEQSVFANPKIERLEAILD